VILLVTQEVDRTGVGNRNFQSGQLCRESRRNSSRNYWEVGSTV